ncbi:hypothetical protein [Methylobacterium sp. Leaf88]|uniref:hypothetical protein n=1 Tax=Methylobacterium sp. Leaf88 TaxID=1736244 RepID=UPI0012E88B6A|nr:hypothetical protein [Methylobacterium sp. Leaf88]
MTATDDGDLLCGYEDIGRHLRLSSRQAKHLAEIAAIRRSSYRAATSSAPAAPPSTHGSLNAMLPPGKKLMLRCRKQ